MALTYEGQQLTNQQRRAQVAIARELVADLRATWPLLDPLRLDATAPGWMQVVLSILTQKHGLSVQAASAYLTQFRIAEIGRSSKAVQGINPPLSAAAPTSVLVTGPVKVKQGMTAGLTVNQASTAAFQSLASTAILYVLDGGRDTIVTAGRRDRMALGWQRVTDGSPCYFCAMLASRGAVYGKRSFTKEVHGKCGCTLEPVYGRDTNWAGEAGRYSDLWYESTKGLSGQEAVKAFRRAYNGTEGGTATVTTLRTPIPVDTTLIDRAKELNRQAQAAFRAGDDAERVRLQAEASALFREAYSQTSEAA